MKTLDLNQMEKIQGSIDKYRKCGIGVSIGCGFVGLAFGLALSPFGGFLAGAACSSAASASGYCA